MVGLLAFVGAWLCFFVVWSAISSAAIGAQIALLLLCAGAIAGFARLFTLFLPIALVKLLPSIEPPNRQA